MEKSGTSDTNVATVKGTELHTMTPEGRAYVEKKIHPPAPTPASYTGRPTTSSQEICIFQTTGETDISPVFKYQIGKEETTRYPDKMLLLSMPGGLVGQYIFYATSDDSFAQQSAFGLPPDTKVQPPATLLSGYDWKENYQRDVGSHFLDYKSTTVYANCTGFNNQGLITTGIFKPDIVTTHDGTSNRSSLLDYANTLSPRCRANLAKTLRAPLSKSHKHRKIDEDGFEVISEEPTHDLSAFANTTYQFLNWGHQKAITSDLGGQIVITGLFPKDVGEIQVMSRNTATRPFVDGAFIVERDSQEVQTFVPRPLIVPTPGIYEPLVVCMMVWYNPSTLTTYHYLLNAITYGSGIEMLPYSTDIPWTDLTASLTIIQGLTVPAEGQIANNGLPMISVKTVCGYVVQPAPKSSLRVFMTESPMPDRAALEMIACINRQRPDSAPAKMNDAGTIMSAILSLAPSVISFLTTAFGKKKAEPKPKPVKAAPKITNKGKTTFKPPMSGTLVSREQPPTRKPRQTPRAPAKQPTNKRAELNRLMSEMTLVPYKPTNNNNSRPRRR